MKRTFSALGAVLLLAASALAQGTNGNSLLGGTIASNYGKWYVIANNAVAVGAGTMNFTAANCVVNAGDKAVMPLNINASIYVADGTNSETVTPSAVTFAGGLCSISATFANAHGANVHVSSGTGGLQEAINDVVGSGFVWVTPDSAVTAAEIAAATGSASIGVISTAGALPTFYSQTSTGYVKAGTSATAYGNLPGAQWYGYKNTSLTPIVAPTAGTFGVSANASGIAAATYRVTQTCVDPLGGETLISTDTSTTVTTTSSNGNITATFPTCATGSVGWEEYISAAAGIAGSEIFYSPSAAGCVTLSALGVKPSCALTSGSVTTALVTSTALIPVQATAYAMAIEGEDVVPVPYLRSWPPFAVTGVQTFTTAYTLAQFTFPAGYLNQVGKTVQICGNYNLTPSATGTDVVTVLGANQFGVSANTLITWTSGALTNAAYEAPFCFTMTTQVAGASGTVEVHGSIKFALASTGVQPAAGYTDANTATVALGDLTKQVSISLASTPGTSNVTQGQMRNFVIFPLN